MLGKAFGLPTPFKFELTTKSQEFERFVRNESQFAEGEARRAAGRDSPP
jgi:hypothetical protein